ncbi:arylesterase [Leptobacterium flavescens]|uniref:Arylesterase n=1 Tax=Leptobacterium flavescens TaxID=472055 RepID=A0A6P0UPR7_9FLAO|nr:arylesterase [Leptobacterium flavescens]NER12903.1 arylesterase [Leptobacterium flavescens]
MQTILKFRYFLVFLLLISCGGDSGAKKESQSTKDTDTENTVTSSTNKTILFFGDSLTAGFGLEVDEAFPALIQSKLDSLQLSYTVINSGLSGETTAGGRNRLNWVLNQKVDVFVLELGANDGLRGIPLQETRNNLQAIIDQVWQKSPETVIVLAGMQLPPNMGQDYTSEFRTIFPELAEKNEIPLIPFLLKDVGGIPELNQEDGIHPTVEGQKIVANNVWEVLGPIVSK